MDKKIKELLDRRDILSEIAEQLYGDFWVTNEKFYNSPTELEMREISFQLMDLGYKNPDINEDTIAFGEILYDELTNKGIINEDDIPNWWEEDDEDDDNWFV